MRTSSLCFSLASLALSLVACGGSTSTTTNPDSGHPADSGHSNDAGHQQDSGHATDSGHSPDAGHTADSGTSTDTGTPPGDASKEDAASEDAHTDAEKTHDAATDAAQWTPADLNGLVLWLDAAKGVTANAGTGAVSAWADQSGKANTFSQATGLNQPSLQKNVLNGLPVIEFLQTFDNYLSIQPLPTSLTFGTGDFLIMEVVAYSNTPSSSQDIGYAALYVPSPSSGLFGNDNLATPPNASIRAQVNGTGNFVDSASTTFNDGNYHIIGMQRTSTSLVVHADSNLGTGATIPATADLTSGSIGAFIGGRIETEGANQALQGTIAEVVAVNTTVGLSDLVSLTQYFQAKYKLP